MVPHAVAGVIVPPDEAAPVQLEPPYFRTVGDRPSGFQTQTAPKCAIRGHQMHPVVRGPGRQDPDALFNFPSTPNVQKHNHENRRSDDSAHHA
jgi:hypothetical protein